MPIPVNAAPLEAFAVDGEVLLLSRGPGMPVSAAFTPQAVLASLEPMRIAAERAVKQQTDPAYQNEEPYLADPKLGRPDPEASP